jgi:hypothetical protein
LAALADQRANAVALDAAVNGGDTQAVLGAVRLGSLGRHLVDKVAHIRVVKSNVVLEDDLGQHRSLRSDNDKHVSIEQQKRKNERTPTCERSFLVSWRVSMPVRAGMFSALSQSESD